MVLMMMMTSDDIEIDKVDDDECLLLDMTRMEVLPR